MKCMEMERSQGAGTLRIGYLRDHIAPFGVVGVRFELKV